jgi:hypothetical protein
MLKWDAISWWATALFILSAILAAVFKNDAYLFLMVGSYMLRPTLYALGVATKYADERQMSIQYRSGNLALTIVILAIILFAIKARIEGKPADDFNALLVIALAARAVTGVLMIGDYRSVAMKISISLGALWLLFVLAENGFSLAMLKEGSPGILIALIGVLGKWQPKISGAIFGILACVACYFIGFRTGHGFTFYQAMTSMLVAVPLLASSYCFFKGSKTEGQPHAAE